MDVHNSTLLNSRGKWLIILSFALFFSSLVFFLNTSIGDDFYAKVFPDDAFVLEFRDCFAQGDIGPIVKCVDSKIAGWMETVGSANVAEELEQYENFGGICHAVGHIVGGSIYNTEQNLPRSLASCTNACFNSCLHGAVIEFGFQEGTGSLLSLKPEEVCRDTTNSYGEYQLCIHGFGHAFMLGTDYRTSVALKACDSNLDPLSGHTTKGSCYSGVFMELFLAAEGDGHETIPEEEYEKKGDMFYTCCKTDIAHTPYEGACYIQLVKPLWRKAWEDGRSIFDACREAPYEEARSACFAGIGLMQASQDPSQPYAVTTCEKITDPTNRNECLYGALSYFAFQVPTNVLEKSFCRILTHERDANRCKEFLETYPQD